MKNRRLAAKQMFVKTCSCKRDTPEFLDVQCFSCGISVRSLEWSTSEFGDFLEELGDLSWSPPQGMSCALGVVDSLTRKTQGSGAATPKEELLGDRDLTWHPRGEASARQTDQ